MSFKSFITIKDALESNVTNETFESLSKNEFRNKKQTKKNVKVKKKREELIIAKTILKIKKRKTLNKEMSKNKYDLIKR